MQVERERWRAASSQRMGQFLMPSASTGNIPGGFRSLQGRITKSIHFLHSIAKLCFLFLALENYRALKIKNSVIANNGQYCEKVFSTCQVVENFGLVTLVSLTFEHTLIQNSIFCPKNRF